MIDNALNNEIWNTVRDIDSWLDTQRLSGGYGGFVVHWWNDCLTFTGPGLDWRYEGIICGYVNLWLKTNHSVWLQKARRAGDDLVRGQLPSGNFINSCFELNPNTEGTPHEAAADIGLLHLAAALRLNQNSDWEVYYHSALKNLEHFYIGRLWDPQQRRLRDSARQDSFVPNKAATWCEALFALARLSINEDWIERYALPTLDCILEHQIKYGKLSGAINQNSFSMLKVQKYFPFYICRCIPALVEGYRWSGQSKYLDAAIKASEFVLAFRFSDGSFPQVVYPQGNSNAYPRWVAAVSDMLRAFDLVAEYGLEYDRQPTIGWLLKGKMPDGSIRSAVGFGNALIPMRLNDKRDEITCCGWVDKAFRYFTNLVREDRIANATH